MRVIDAIALRLEAFGIEPDNIFAGSDVHIPGGAGPFISIAESGGPGPVGTHNGTSMRRPTFQITARGDEFQVTATLADLAFDALGGKDGAPITNMTIGDFFFLFIRPSSEILQLPIDAQQRVRLSFNVATQRR